MPLIVYHPTLKHYADLLSQTNFLEWTWNTLLVAAVSTAISLVFGVMLAYPLARMRFAGSALVAFGVAATYLVPQPLLFIPLADIITKLGLERYADLGHFDLSDVAHSVLRLAADGLFSLGPA